MQVPFSAPKVPELNALSVEQRKQVMAQYADSLSAKQLVRIIQLSMSQASPHSYRSFSVFLRTVQALRKLYARF
jgi:hypothetical protein